MNQEYKLDLLNQIRESYGRVTYSYTTYLKKMNRLEKKFNNLKTFQIILSAITAGGFVGTLFSEYLFAIIGAIISTLLLTINVYLKDFKLNEEISLCRRASDDLWEIREEYISLLTDSVELNTTQLKEKRDDEIKKLSIIYKKYPKTDKKSYTAAQTALKSEEEQFFSDEELNKMLPKHLRN